MNFFRLFIAIELPAEVRHKIRKHIDRLRAKFPDVRASWTREENLHLTLKFLGDVPENKVAALSQALQLAATKVTSFEMEISGCGVFPPRGKPSVLWIGLSPEAAPAPQSSCVVLHAAIEDACARVGFTRDRRAFHPHLTIARLRHPHGARELAQLHREMAFDPLLVKVKDVCLIRSELSSQGSQYTVISRHEFPA